MYDCHVQLASVYFRLRHAYRLSLWSHIAEVLKTWGMGRDGWQVIIIDIATTGVLTSSISKEGSVYWRYPRRPPSPSRAGQNLGGLELNVGLE